MILVPAEMSDGAKVETEKVQLGSPVHAADGGRHHLPTTAVSALEICRVRVSGATPREGGIRLVCVHISMSEGSLMSSASGLNMSETLVLWRPSTPKQDWEGSGAGSWDWGWAA